MAPQRAHALAAQAGALICFALLVALALAAPTPCDENVAQAAGARVPTCAETESTGANAMLQMHRKQQRKAASEDDEDGPANKDDDDDNDDEGDAEPFGDGLAAADALALQDLSVATASTSCRRSPAARRGFRNETVAYQKDDDGNPRLLDDSKDGRLKYAFVEVLTDSCYSTDESRPAVLFLHGRNNNRFNMFHYAKWWFTLNGWVAFSFEWSIGNCMRDGQAAIDWFHENHAQYGAEPEYLLFGYSMGGMCMAKVGLLRHQENVRGVVMASSPLSESDWHLADASCPPLLFITAKNDKKVGWRRAQRMAENFTAAGMNVTFKLFPDGGHSPVHQKHQRAEFFGLVADFTRSVGLCWHE